MADTAARTGQRSNLLASTATGLAPFLGVPAARRAEGDDDDGEMTRRRTRRAAEPQEDAGDDDAGSDEGGEHPGEEEPVAERDEDDAEGEDGEDDDGDPEDDDRDDDEDEEGERERLAAAAATREPKARRRAVVGIGRQIRTAAEKRACAKERKRIGAILRHPAAERNLALANHLAFATRIGAKAARAMLDAAPAAGGRLDARMAGYGYRPGPSSRPAATGQTALNASWDDAAKIAGI